MQSSRRKFLQDTSVLAAASLAAHHGVAIAQQPTANGPPRSTLRGSATQLHS